MRQHNTLYPEYMTISQAGQFMGVGKTSAGLVIRALVAWHGLPLRQQCGMRVKRSDLEKLLDSLTAEGLAISVDCSVKPSQVKIGAVTDSPPLIEDLKKGSYARAHIDVTV